MTEWGSTSKGGREIKEKVSEKGRGSRGMSIQVDSYPILQMNQESSLSLLLYLEQTLSSVRGWGRVTERWRINYRLNKLLCYSARPLPSAATAEGSFCQSRSSWGGCNVGTDSRGHFSESLIVFWEIIAPVVGCSQLQYHVLQSQKMLFTLLSSKSNKNVWKSTN